MREVAQATGLSIPTVSRALGSGLRCAPETRARVRSAAEAMGYRPDPALSALVAHRSGGVWKSPYNLAWTGSLVGTATNYHGAVMRAFKIEAERLGYGFVVSHLQEHGSPRRHARALEARGVRGIVWASPTHPTVLGEFPWERFCHVGYVLATVRPAIHLVREDHLNTVAEAVRVSFEAGFRRPGMVLLTAPGSHNDRQQIAGWLLAHHELGLSPQVPVLQCYARDMSSAIEDWLSAHSPDLILGNVRGVWTQLSFLSHRHWPYLGLDCGEGLYVGFDCCREEIGQVLASVLDSYVRRNFTGMVEHPREIILRRSFSEMDALRALARRSQRRNRRMVVEAGGSPP